jgi:SAM-dependent methyltransferase
LENCPWQYVSLTQSKSPRKLLAFRAALCRTVFLLSSHFQNGVAKEMVRVTRPGGRVVMGNWIPHDPTLVAQILKISTAYSPPPPEGFVSPMTWGIESNVIERFAATGVPKENVSFLKDTYTFNFPGPPSEFVAAFRKYYGPTMNAFAAAEKDGRAGDLQKELEVLFNSQNRSPNKASTSIPATFLRVTVARN